MLYDWNSFSSERCGPWASCFLKILVEICLLDMLWRKRFLNVINVFLFIDSRVEFESHFILKGCTCQI